MDRWTVRSAVRRFALGAAVTLAVLVLVSLFIARMVAREATLDEAEDRTTTIADSLAAPLVTSQFRHGDQRAVNDMARLMSNRMSDATIRHIKIWSDDGTVLWSDETVLIGKRFPLEDDEKEALRTHTAVAEYSDLSAPENAEERDEAGPTLETYVGATGADGSQILFETYMSPERAAARQEAIVRASMIVGVAALVVFGVAILPLSLRLARGVERAHVDRERMTQHALLSSELERRRIAQDLHDGVIQDLAGAGLVLPLVADRVRSSSSSPQDGELLTRIHDLVARNVLRLRSLMAQVYPPDLTGPGLQPAIENLVRESADQVDTEVHLDPELRLGEGASRLAYRIVREGLRNVVKHADASSALVEIRHEEGWVHVLVADDGQGVPDEAPPVDGEHADADDGLPLVEGHLGLRLLRDSVRDAGGQLELVPNRPQGTRLRAKFLEDVPGF